LDEGDIALDLRDNHISNLQQLVDNPGLGAGDGVDVRVNPLSGISLKSYIPVLQARGVNVLFGKPPPPPTNLTAVVISSSQIDLSWQDNSDNEDGFQIERKVVGEEFQLIVQVEANVTRYSDTGLHAHTTYTYRVRAFIEEESHSEGSNKVSTTTLEDTQVTTPDTNLEIAPTGLQLVPFHTTIQLKWESYPTDISGFSVYRRVSKQEYSTEPTIYVGNVQTITDYNLQPGVEYFYRIAARDQFGNESIKSAEVSGITDTDGSRYSVHPSLDVLVVIYTQGLDSGEPERLRNGIELSHQFYWRNSTARLNLNINYLYVPTLPPTKHTQLGPRTLDIAEFEVDLRSRGIQNDQFDVAYATGQLDACFATNGTILGLTGIASGSKCGIPYPGDDKDVDYTVTWTFTHEFQHVLDGTIAHRSGHPEMLHGHPEDAYAQKSPNQIYDSGWHYDWQATILRVFDAYDAFLPPWDGYIETVDMDQDYLPDQDSRLPIDEAKLGSNPHSKDSDSDGLSDLDEFTAGIYRSSNLNNEDSDGDGIQDAQDAYPLSNVVTELRHTSLPLQIDGTIESAWNIYCSDYYFSDLANLKSKTYAAWDEDYLYFAASANKLFRLSVRVDGSGENGLFEGGDAYELRADYGGNKLLFDEGQASFVEIKNGKIGTGETANGEYVIEVAIPKNIGKGYGLTGETTSGLTLREGKKIGFNVILANLENIGSPFDRFSGQKAFLFEPYRFYDVVLKSGSVSPQLLPWDVNQDGVVDVLDLVVVGRHFGKHISDPILPNPDVNGDGQVNILDLVMVGKHFGERTLNSAPARRKMIPAK